MFVVSDISTWSWSILAYFWSWFYASDFNSWVGWTVWCSKWLNIMRIMEISVQFHFYSQIFPHAAINAKALTWVTPSESLAVNTAIPKGVSAHHSYSPHSQMHLQRKSEQISFTRLWFLMSPPVLVSGQITVVYNKELQRVWGLLLGAGFDELLLLPHVNRGNGVHPKFL